MDIIEAKIDWSYKNVWEYVKFNSLYKSKLQKLIIISLCVCFFFVLLMGVISYIATSNIVLLIITIVAAVFVVAYTVFFYFMMKSLAKKLLGIKESMDGLEFTFAENSIIMKRNNGILRVFEWNEITEILFNKKAEYLMTNEGAMILISNENITSGTAESLIKLLKIKVIENGNATESK